MIELGPLCRPHQAGFRAPQGRSHRSRHNAEVGIIVNPHLVPSDFGDRRFPVDRPRAGTEQATFRFSGGVGAYTKHASWPSVIASLDHGVIRPVVAYKRRRVRAGRW
jgi:hypothetical protein